MENLSNSPCAPFDDVDADIVFRSSDGITFNIYKVVIAKASPVMRDMLALPECGNVELREPQVVQLTENARTLNHLFRLCYPVDPPTIDNVDDIRAVLDAARKYDMAAATASMKWVLQHHLPRDALRIYALSYMLGAEDIVRQAAELLLDGVSPHLPASPPVELDMLPASAICAVHTYRERRVAAAQGVLKDHGMFHSGEGGIGTPSSWIWFGCANCPKSSEKWGTSHPLEWWIFYMRALGFALSRSYSPRLGDIARTFLATAESRDALREISSCARCTKAYPYLIKFNTLMAQRIDDAVKVVKLEVPFASQRHNMDSAIADKKP